MKDNILSFHMNPKYLYIINKISHSQADGPFKPQPPRMFSVLENYKSAFLTIFLVEHFGP